jgi:hypothetical protein
MKGDNTKRKHLNRTDLKIIISSVLGVSVVVSALPIYLQNATPVYAGSYNRTAAMSYADTFH